MVNNIDFLYFKEDEDEFFQRWDDFVVKNKLPYSYISEFINYMVCYGKNIHLNESFVVVQNNKTVGIAFLPIEKTNDMNTMTLSNEYFFGPVANTEKIEKEIYAQIDRIALSLTVKKIKVYLNPLISAFRYHFNPLVKYGYLDTSTTDGVLPLGSLDEVWRNISKGHKSAIKKVLRDKQYSIRIIDKDNCRYEYSENYRALHEKCAGRVTRPKSTFDSQYRMVENGNSFYGILEFEQNIVAVCYFITSGGTAVYQSAANDPEHQKIPFYHALIWKAIEYLISKGVGSLSFQSPCGYSMQFDDYLDLKQYHISRFKRGFGLSSVSSYRGIKYFDKQVFLNDIDLFKKNYSETIDECK